MKSVGIRWFLGGVILVVSVAGLALDGRHGFGSMTALVPQVGLDKSEGPRVVIDNHDWNFGQVRIGETLCAKFRVRNEGTRRLLLDNRGDCCGSARQEIIPPGEMREFKFLIDTSQRQTGPGREVVCYDTNDRLQPTLVFTLVFELKLNDHPSIYVR